MIRSIARLLPVFIILTTIACHASSAAVKLPNPAADEALSKTKSSQTVVLAGGCFWGIQAVFEHVKGVSSATAGYSGGAANTAQYETVSTGRTGHAESVKVIYDPSQVSFGQILKVFFSVAHDPTELNRQGPDEGTQYRSAIFFSSEEQHRIARAYIDQLDGAKTFARPIVTQVVALQAFYPAEGYHQDYAEHHPHEPYIAINDLPKLDHLKQTLPELYVGK
ncbi:MAG TPA: peptide-methionine (S)-S-oxide reductase MsrA [Candidatus Dormibacteraeota bacterium]|nr:peptide-methionine (S)-S-oxide reductase MsrA [Candidatus Dormibacteraeota bacterium]